MALIEWKPEYSVGDPAIDHEHRELIDLVNRAAADIFGDGTEHLVAGRLGDLLRAISAHFALEERLMREARYDQLAEHKGDHERLLDELRDIMDGTGQHHTLTRQGLVAALEPWFADHFRTHDSRLHRALGPEQRG